jgi:hypothetical protein
MSKYYLRVKREIIVSVIVEASSKEDALEKYQNESFEEEIEDSSDLEDPDISLIEDC